MKTKLTRAEKSWILYDVGNSAFTMLVATTIPILFKGLTESAGIDTVYASGLWSTVTAVAVLILALLSPVLGALADYAGMKKKMFVGALIVGLLGLAGLSVTGSWIAYLVFFVVARLGYSACNVFYDAMLTDVTTDERMDSVSSHGYAWGYIGSCIPFIAGIVLIFTLPFGMTTVQATQASYVITAVWWIALTIPLLRNVKQTHGLADREGKLTDVFRRLGETFRKLKQDKALLFYILAYFFYIDGVYTIISLATTYGTEVGISSTQLILALLLTQFVAFPSAIIVSRLAAKHGAIRMIRVSIIAYTIICLFGYQLDKAWEFWLLAVAVGLFQGGIQSLSRSQFGRMIPKDEANEYFGLFDVFGKGADFFGPLIMAASAFVLGSSSYGILALVVLFIIGYILLTKSEKYMNSK
ncbi:MAG: MFS transporter [Butyricicoccus sp.]|nr:MFS transporter [Butyricicoccus sp.]